MELLKTLLQRPIKVRHTPNISFQFRTFSLVSLILMICTCYQVPSLAGAMKIKFTWSLHGIVGVANRVNLTRTWSGLLVSFQANWNQEPVHTVLVPSNTMVEFFSKYFFKKRKTIEKIWIWPRTNPPIQSSSKPVWSLGFVGSDSSSKLAIGQVQQIVISIWYLHGPLH